MLLAPEVLGSYREQMAEALEAGDHERAATLAQNLSPRRCARVLKEAPAAQIAHVYHAMPGDPRGAVLANLPASMAAALLAGLEDAEAAAWLAVMTADHAVDVIGANVLVAGVVGGTLPFLIKRLGKDPAMMTGPVLTTITDITGVTIYLGLCTVFLSSLLAG